MNIKYIFWAHVCPKYVECSANLPSSGIQYSACSISAKALHTNVGIIAPNAWNFCQDPGQRIAASAATLPKTCLSSSAVVMNIWRLRRKPTSPKKLTTTKTRFRGRNYGAVLDGVDISSSD